MSETSAQYGCNRGTRRLGGHKRIPVWKAVTSMGALPDGFDQVENARLNMTPFEYIRWYTRWRWRMALMKAVPEHRFDVKVDLSPAGFKSDREALFRALNKMGKIYGVERSIWVAEPYDDREDLTHAHGLILYRDTSVLEEFKNHSCGMGNTLIKETVSVTDSTAYITKHIMDDGADVLMFPHWRNWDISDLME